ncbi:hypothetical protein U9M48_020408 [Paspalum notatum var. saurae]|uniref:Uncharacterized protein n=1 Tax=Paspalum notatum var. saurae TaxID=547442 RepID=A0AAQ3WSL4_PASNO
MADEQKGLIRHTANSAVAFWRHVSAGARSLLLAVHHRGLRGVDPDPVLVPLGDVDEDEQVDGAEHGEQPVEVVEPADVDVLRQPRRPARGVVPRGGVHGGVERGRHEAAEPAGDGGVRGAHAAHGVGRLLVQELEQRDEAEHLGHADEAVLDEQPVGAEVRHGREEEGQVAVPDGVPAAVALEDPRPGDGEHGEEEAQPDALQLGRAVRVAREAPGQRREGLVVERQDEEDGEAGEDGHARHREVQRRHAGVERVGLLHRQREELGEHHAQHHRARRHGKQPQQDLDLLHLRHRAQPPRVHRLLLTAGAAAGSEVAFQLQRGLVKPPEVVGVVDLGAAPDGGLGAGDLVEADEVAAVEGRVPLPEGGDEDLRHPRERAAPRHAVPVQRRADEEERVGGAHGERERAERGGPSAVHLDVHHGRERGDGADGDGEVEEVEESVEAALVPRAPLVELIGAEGGDAGPDPRGPERRHVQRRLEVRHLPRPRRLAPAQQHGQRVAPFLGGHERRHAGADGERDEAQQVHGGEGGDGPVPAEVGVGEESPQHGGGLGDAKEVVDGVGGAGEGAVHDLEHEDDHVDGEAEVGHALRHLVAEDEEGGRPAAGPRQVRDRLAAEVDRRGAHRGGRRLVAAAEWRPPSGEAALVALQEVRAQLLALLSRRRERC